MDSEKSSGEPTGTAHKGLHKAKWPIWIRLPHLMPPAGPCKCCYNGGYQQLPSSKALACHLPTLITNLNKEDKNMLFLSLQNYYLCFNSGKGTIMPELAAGRGGPSTSTHQRSKSRWPKHAPCGCWLLLDYSITTPHSANCTTKLRSPPYPTASLGGESLYPCTWSISVSRSSGESCGKNPCFRAA